MSQFLTCSNLFSSSKRARASPPPPARKSARLQRGGQLFSTNNDPDIEPALAEDSEPYLVGEADSELSDAPPGFMETPSKTAPVSNSFSVSDPAAVTASAVTSSRVSDGVTASAVTPARAPAALPSAAVIATPRAPLLTPSIPRMDVSLSPFPGVSPAQADPSNCFYLTDMKTPVLVPLLVSKFLTPRK
jgi:hypothetical protein